ncbi:hypothetical protein EYF80_021034 [Liparis tanakae]|uniref:Uncharacterized protein n=1 Tax=Liparis tanakae TaxID=230148 RepID=A0A4Z2HUX8_9TELE|nr:hypothetical protein EYF80_021034 [Liparis tanakae]
MEAEESTGGERGLIDPLCRAVLSSHAEYSSNHSAPAHGPDPNVSYINLRNNEPVKEELLCFRTLISLSPCGLDPSSQSPWCTYSSFTELHEGQPEKICSSRQAAG